jgi:Class III cytochrome C family
MTKRTIVVLFLISIFTLWREVILSDGVDAQRARPAKSPDYSKFQHSSHRGRVKSLIERNKLVEVDCAYCHGTAVKDKLGPNLHDIEGIGYPSLLNGFQKGKTHSACIECHAFTGSAAPLDMCKICHETTTPNQRQMATNIRRFPNPDGGVFSQFYDDFSHSGHVDYYTQNALMTALKDRIKFYDPKKDEKANKGLDKEKFECSACHTMNQAPVNVGKIDFAPGLKMSAPGHPECFICHFDPKIVTPPKKDKLDPKNTFATNCVGCHLETGKPFKDGRPARGSELAVLWFARKIINTELNPAKPGVKSPLPYSHKTHDEGVVGRTVKDCLSCHATGKTANTFSDFYLEDRKTKEKQPLIWSCVECHKKEMQTKIAGSVTIETAKCNYCHSLQTIREYRAKGVELPPPNHFYKKPAATPATAPTVASAETTKTPESTPMSPPATTSDPPANSPRPEPAPTPVAGTGKPQTMPKMPRLGDPKDNPHWGRSDKWGVVENFDHETHTTPKYSKKCEECHHTNKDASAEMALGMVPLCTSCHKEKGNAANPLNKEKEEIDVEVAYHGNPNNQSNNAGCIECHKRYYDTNADAERKAPTSKCAGCHAEKEARLERWIRPNLRDQRSIERLVAMIRRLKGKS